MLSSASARRNPSLTLTIYRAYSCSYQTLAIRKYHLRPSAAKQNPCRPSVQCIATMPKRKSLAGATQETAFTVPPIPQPSFDDTAPPPPKRRASQRKVSRPQRKNCCTNPDTNAEVLDGPEALRASPDAYEQDERLDMGKAGVDVHKQIKEEDDDSSLSEMSEVEQPVETKKGKGRSNRKTAPAAKKSAKEDPKKVTAPVQKLKKEAMKEPQFLDPEAEGDEEADEEELQAALSRPPPVNSDYLPLPWKGRLGYVSTDDLCLWLLLTHARLVSAHIYASPILPSSVPEPVASLAFWRIGIPSKIQMRHLMPQRIGQTRSNPQISHEARLSWSLWGKPMQEIL